MLAVALTLSYFVYAKKVRFYTRINGNTTKSVQRLTMNVFCENFFFLLAFSVTEAMGLLKVQMTFHDGSLFPNTLDAEDYFPVAKALLKSFEALTCLPGFRYVAF